MAAQATLYKVVLLLFLLYTITTTANAAWCVVRSDASEQALQRALDYACGAGADCAPIQSSGLCYLPNTMQAHASYAFNSYYQRRGNVPDSCSFAGTATIATTNPSYGSCVYPPTPSTAGGMVGQGGPPVVGTIPPTITGQSTLPGTAPPLYGGLNPVLGPVVPDSPTSNAQASLSITTILSNVVFLLVFLVIFHTM